MSFHFAEAACALLVACGYASLAEVCLNRRSRTPGEWNESFVIGGGMAAAALFPLSLLFPHNALEILLGVLALAAVGVSTRMVIFRPGTAEPRAAAGPLERWFLLSVTLGALLAAAAVTFAILNARTAFAWDGFQTWATKAYLLFSERALRPEMWPGSLNEARSGRTVSYPNLVPLTEALAAVLRGHFDFLGVKPVFLLFYLSMLISVGKGARDLTPRSPSPRGEGMPEAGVRWAFGAPAPRSDGPRESNANASPRGSPPPLQHLERGLGKSSERGDGVWPLAAVALLALLPTFTSRQSVGGNADLPQAAAVAALAAAWLAPNPRAGRWNSPTPWLLGAVLMVKSEGGILFASACLAALVFTRREPIGRKLREHAGSLTIGVILLAGRLLYLRWTTVPDTTYGPIDSAHLAQAWSRLGLVTKLCARELLDFSTWGLLWPALGLAVIVCLLRGGPREKGLALAAALALAAYSGIFLFTNWPVELQIQQAYRRLLTQLAPAAALCLASGFLRAIVRAPARALDRAAGEPVR